MNTLLLMYVFTGLLLVVLAIPLYLGKIGPNGLYGFRVRRTLEHPELWYPVNKYAARWLIASGLALVASAVGFSFVPGMDINVYPLACLVVFTLVFATGMAFTVRYMNSLD